MLLSLGHYYSYCRYTDYLHLQDIFIPFVIQLFFVLPILTVGIIFFINKFSCFTLQKKLKLQGCFAIYSSCSLLLRFKFPAAAVLLIIRYWASWSDRSWTVGDTEDELSLILFTKISSVAVPESFWMLLHNLQYVWSYMLLVMSLLVFRFSYRYCIFMLPQIKNSIFKLFRYFKVAYNPLRYWLKSPDGAPYRLNIIKLDVLVSSWLSHISKFCFLQRC
jgi:hypothetical protein